MTSAITDAQELIKFTDTKAAIVITILSAYAVAFFPAIEDLFNNPMAYGICFWVFSSIYLVFYT
ncbi:MAG: hypothetical protein IPL12_11645 [Bacteroidetes bacterium]|nr:hypothetical protein [Bacteroidota bacterium]